METSSWKEKHEDYICLLSSDDEALPVKEENIDPITMGESEIEAMQIQSM